jgi:hypothetical protein
MRDMIGQKNLFLKFFGKMIGPMMYIIPKLQSSQQINKVGKKITIHDANKQKCNW